MHQKDIFVAAKLNTFCSLSYVNGLVGEQMVEVTNPRIQTFPVFQLTLRSGYIQAFPVIAQIAYKSTGTLKTSPGRLETKSNGVFGLHGTEDSP